MGFGWTRCRKNRFAVIWLMSALREQRPTLKETMAVSFEGARLSLETKFSHWETIGTWRIRRDCVTSKNFGND